MCLTVLKDNVKDNIFDLAMYKVNELNVGVPAGSIVAYLGTTDPSGWVICDGTARTNNSDNRYNRLNALSIGTGGSGTTSYTPPDLRGSFLRGTGTSPINSVYSGASLKSYQDMGTFNHTHYAPPHKHITSYEQATLLKVGNSNTTSSTYVNPTLAFRLTYEAVRTMNTAVTGDSPLNLIKNISGVSSTYSSVETRPYNYGVNWIIKL